MGRSWRRHAVRHSGWTRTAREAASPALVQSTTSPVLVTPEPSGNDADAIVIEANVLARLLGVKLLTLEGSVLLSRAQVQALVDERPASNGYAKKMHTANVATERSAVSHPHETVNHPNEFGPGLAEAARLIAANASTIDAIHRPER